MKANEFVKKFGWGKASSELSVFQSSLAVNFGWSFVDELKRLVESHELVKSYGGLGLAKKELQRQSILRWINPETERLRGAIADVESCSDQHLNR